MHRREPRRADHHRRRLIDSTADYLWSLIIIGGAAWRAESALAAYYHRRLAPSLGEPYQPLLCGSGGGPLVRDHAVSTLDWYRPTMGELAHELLPTADRPAEETADELERRCVQAFSVRHGGAQRFHALLALTRQSATERAICAAEFTLPWPTMRRAILQFGALLQEQGILTGHDDVFFLLRSELQQAVSGSAPADLRQKVNERRGTWNAQARLRPPLAIGTPAYLLRMLIPPAARPAAAEPGVLRGIGVSPGRATGRARLIDHGTPTADQFNNGDIMVVRAFVPALATLLTRAAAVVSDTGSAAAHTSVLAREFGVPGVVGLTSVTQRVRDGEIITVDGTEGTVRIGQAAARIVS